MYTNNKIKWVPSYLYLNLYYTDTGEITKTSCFA